MPPMWKWKIPASWRILLALFVAIAMSVRPTGGHAHAGEAPADETHTPAYGYRIVNEYPHDPAAFTQGLFFDRGYLYESTGLNGRSSVRQVELTTGKVVKINKLPVFYFGEGMTAWQNLLIQLTWQSHVGFVYDRESLELLRTFSYAGEGWGITQVGPLLVMSDGTEYLRFLNPATFEEVSRIEVRDRGAPVKYLNELEFVKGEIFANIWRTERIARVSPQTGEVLGWINLAGLKSALKTEQPVDVLNGIAYDAAKDRLYVTGKLWPRLFEIQLIDLR